MFAFVHLDDQAELKKALKDTLQYVEAYARNGYIGTVAGVNVYAKKDAERGTIAFATKKAVTLFIKKGTEIEKITSGQRSEDSANRRKNTIFSRKYYLAALTDDTKALRLVKGSATASADETVTEGKKYYAKSGNTYTLVTPAEDANPQTSGWYEIT